MTIRTPPEVEFANTPIIGLPREAPKDGSWFVGKDRSGEIAHIRWRKDADLEDGDEPYWARWDTDEVFDMVAWVPTSWTYDDMMKVYG